MTHFHYRDDALWVEDLRVQEIIDTVGTPCYIYSHTAVVDQWHTLQRALETYPAPHQICYAVKANSNLAILQSLAALGSGFDIVSGGELARVIAAGGNPQQVVFSGVGKSPADINFALQHGIGCFNVESEPELELLNQIAAHHQVRAPIALRINPHIDPQSHPYISTGIKDSKFGIDWRDAPQHYARAQALEHIQIKGIACHIGSQITTLAPFVEAAQCLLQLINQITQQGITIEHINLGGGLGVSYQNECPPTLPEYVEALQTVLAGHNPQLLLEPGRAMVAQAGILATQVLICKHTRAKNFCIVDAAMNDFIRPALYQAWHDIIPLIKSDHSRELCYDVVGPICESSDFLGTQRWLQVSPGDYLAVRSAGAYGAVMSSHYNTRPKAAEVMVRGNVFKIVRPRESVAQLLRQETLW